MLINKIKEREDWVREERRRIWGPDYHDIPFPVRLHKLISCEQFSSALWWVDGGEAFAVQKNGYRDHIMNVFFDESKFRSLQTLLHKYGFHRLRTVADALPNVMIYRHDLFIRGDIDLCKNIKRNKNPPKAKSSPVQDEIHTNKISLPKQDLHDDDDLHSLDCCSLSSEEDFTLLKLDG
jgi:hypothetical protein